MPGEVIDRLTPEDLVSLATDVGPAPMQVGAVLELGGPWDRHHGEVLAELDRRVAAVPRLRRRLQRLPLGCGRPIWVDDDRFAIGRHVSFRTCPPPGDEEALLRVAAATVADPLPRDRPLWRLVVVEGLAGGGAAVVVVFHHVLADGIGGLAVLASLVDGTTPLVDPAFPRAIPPRRVLARDAALGRWAAVRDLPRSLGRAREALRQLGSSGGGRAPACSLNRPTGPRRRLDVVRVPLGEVRSAAHAGDASVNDVVLAGVAGALARLLDARGERVDRFVVSVPVAARSSTSAADLGNEVGVVPIALPGGGAGPAALPAIAAQTRAAKGAGRGASAAVVGPAFRLLARLGVFHRFIDRQRLVHTFTTNLRGPDEALALLGRPVEGVLPVAVVTGNVTVSFAVLSYAGTLATVIISDPDACPDVDTLREALVDELRTLASTAP